MVKRINTITIVRHCISGNVNISGPTAIINTVNGIILTSNILSVYVQIRGRCLIFSMNCITIDCRDLSVCTNSCRATSIILRIHTILTPIYFFCVNGQTSGRASILRIDTITILCG